ncbi:MAG: response regulator transcription factor [Mariniphaga sp.]
MSTNKIYNVIIADSQFLVVETLRSLIDKDEKYTLAGIAGTYEELLKILTKNSNGLLITDIATIDYNGLDDLKTIREKYPNLVMLILTNSLNKADFSGLSRLGIKNIIYKNVDRDELFSAIEATLKCKKYYSEEIIDAFLDTGESKFNVEETKNMTVSEIEIVKMIANGLTTKEIAVKRNISHHTVNTHRKNIFRKLEVTNASELIILAIKSGWIDNIEYYI